MALLAILESAKCPGGSRVSCWFTTEAIKIGKEKKFCFVNTIIPPITSGVYEEKTTECQLC